MKLTFCLALVLMLGACNNDPTVDQINDELDDLLTMLDDAAENEYDGEEPMMTSGNYVQVMVDGDTVAALNALAEHVAKANSENMRPFVYFSAGWCAPCQAIKKTMDDPMMVDAFDGVYLIEMNYDNYSDWAYDHYLVTGIPAWSGLLEDGTSNWNVIDGGAWGENIPENMAPALKKYFNDTTDYMAEWKALGLD